LKILQGSHKDYILNQDAREYLKQNDISENILTRLETVFQKGKTFTDEQEWEEFLKMVGIRNANHIKAVTEAALTASILAHGFNEKLVILSDEAGQFDVFLHALCWIHAERKIKNIVPINDYQKGIIDKLLDKLWKFYRDLQLYQKNPDGKRKQELENQFDTFCAIHTEFDVINNALMHLYGMKKGLLLVLDRPEIPLNNNISENDIRSIAQKRKVHGGTRGDNGLKSRDTFMSLMKTCRKLEISFYEYLYDRLSQNYDILPLYNIIQLHLKYYNR
jgi:hypothetical protein